MTKPAVVLIGGDKGGVGKTSGRPHVARLFLSPAAAAVRAFDTEVPRGSAEALPRGRDRCRRYQSRPGPKCRIFDTVSSTDAAVQP